MSSLPILSFLNSDPVLTFSVGSPTLQYSPSWPHAGTIASSAYLMIDSIPALRFRDVFAPPIMIGRQSAVEAIRGNTAYWSSVFGPQDTFASAHVSDREAALSAIQSVISLDDNWDGYGAVPVPAEIAQLAARMVSSLPSHVPVPEVSANPNGTISLEWENEQGRSHLEIGRTKFSLYFKRTTGSTLYQSGSIADIDDWKRNLLDEMFPLVPPSDYTISDIRLAKAA
jgi:hypothetical protein